MTVLKKSKRTLNLDTLDADKRSRIESILNPRTAVLGSRHSVAAITNWKRAAEAADLSLREWVEQTLNEKCKGDSK